MENLSLVLSCEADLAVKSFVAREALSSPFDIEIVAVSPADTLPFEAIVGHKATFRVVSPWPEAAPRAWTTPNPTPAAIYDPAAATGQPSAPKTQSRETPHAVRRRDGRVHVVGGDGHGRY